MESHSSPWIGGEPDNPDEMNLMVQREMSNLKALKRLSLNTSVLSAQDPDLPTLEIADESTVAPSTGTSNSLSQEVERGSNASIPSNGLSRTPSFTRQPSLVRQASLSRQSSFTRRPSLNRQGSIRRGNDSENKIQELGQDSGNIPAYNGPRFARHHSIVNAVNVHRERSAPVRSNTSSEEPISLSENNSDQDISNMWVPAGLHPELAPNEWHAFVEAKLSEIRKSQEHQQHNRSHSRLSHIVSDPEEYVDASALLYNRRTASSSSDDRRKSILELSKDFVDENAHSDIDEPDNNSQQPEMQLGATSLRRSTHRMHKPELNAKPGFGSVDSETKPHSRSLRKAGRMSHSVDKKEPYSTNSSAESKTNNDISAGGSETLFSVKNSSQASSNNGPISAPVRVKPPLSVSITAAKAVAHTAEQPTSPSAATPSPTASVMLGYRRRMLPPKSAASPTTTVQKEEKVGNEKTLETRESVMTNGTTQSEDTKRTDVERSYPAVLGHAYMPHESPTGSSVATRESPTPNITSKSTSQHNEQTEGNREPMMDPEMIPNRSISSTPKVDLPHQNQASAVSEDHDRGSSNWSFTSDIGQKGVPVQSNHLPNQPSPLASAEPTSPPHKEEKAKPERRWKWLDSKSSQDQDSHGDTSPPTKKSFANLFKKKDKSAKSVNASTSEKESQRRASHSGNVKKENSNTNSGTPVSDNKAPSNLPKNDLISGSSVHSGYNSHSPGSGVPEPPPHMIRRGKKGHARVHSRVANNADRSDINKIQRSIDKENDASPQQEITNYEGQHLQEQQLQNNTKNLDHLSPQQQSASSQSMGSTAVDIKLPYDIPAHQVSDRSFVMMYHRFPLHIERAIYRLSHMKLTNPRRPLLQQVLLSNFMYAYLNLINYGYQQQHLAALEDQKEPLDSALESTSRLDDYQIEQLRRIEEHNYDKGLYAHEGGAEDEDSSSSSEEEDHGKYTSRKRTHV